MALGQMLRGSAFMNPNPSQSRSALVQRLLAQSMQPAQSGSPIESLNIASKPILAALLANREDRARGTREQGLAGALSRTRSQDPYQAEAARRAATIIAGEMPESPLAQALLGAQAQQSFPGAQADRLVGVANPSDFEPESLRAYQQSGDPGVLVPRNNMFGRYTPSNYTPESWAAFVQSGDPGVLVNRGDFRFQTTPGGGIVAGNTVTGQVQPTAVTPEVATAEAAERKRAESEAAATGSAVGTAQGAILSRALNAEGIEDILDIAEPLIDEATGSGSGAARDKLLAFFGESTTGAQAIAQLLPLQAAIMLRQPRMEGPQSDRDVQLYREAAGQLGDPNVPNATKKAAIQTIRRLQQIYKNNPTGSAAQPSSGRVRVDAEGNVIGN